MKRLSVIGLAFLFSQLNLLPAQPQSQPQPQPQPQSNPSVKIYTRQDTLRGSITPERAWWDLTYYHLDISVNPADSSVNGTNTVTYRVLHPSSRMQIDLQEPMNITKAVQNNNVLNFKREGNVYWIDLPLKQNQGQIFSIVLSYGGKPRISKMPPWLGGITWKKDKNGLPFIASSCQIDGASLWWPCKDHLYDEPDSMLISVNVPGNLVDVSNGRLRSIENHKNKTKTYNWFVANPINNYGVSINIADYTHFSEIYHGEKGDLDCNYYVLKDDLEKARQQFKQVPMMLAVFEHWFGPYPFYKDGYKLVEAPFLGMEHQSSIAYGNGFINGYMGMDIIRSGFGLKFDYVIVHESAHEWFGNSITNEDIADMWIHESFADYAENLYVEYYNGKEAGSDYVLWSRVGIRNDKPVIGIYNVNKPGSQDMYSKGGNMLHMLRLIINDDEKWRAILRGLNIDFYHKVVRGSDIEDYLSEKTGIYLKPFFNQYIRDTRIPVFEYFVIGNQLSFRWNNCLPSFNMPIKINISGKEQVVKPSYFLTTLKLDAENAVIKVDPGYYVATLNITGK